MTQPVWGTHKTPSCIFSNHDRCKAALCECACHFPTEEEDA